MNLLTPAASAAIIEANKALIAENARRRLERKFAKHLQRMQSPERIPAVLPKSKMVVLP